jgi:hypothetical protein
MKGHEFNKGAQRCACGWTAEPYHVRLEHWEPQWRRHLDENRRKRWCCA